MAQPHSTSTDPIHCGCVIHGDAYDWIYVDRLYNMLKRNLSAFGTFHVWTEADRPVPDHMVKHVLTPMPVRKGWWYKMQIFDPAHFQGNLLYFDLDTVIAGNLDWIRNCDPANFWCVKDFLYLQSYEGWHSINSSMMWFNTQRMAPVWHQFQELGAQGYRGDQDFLQAHVGSRRYFDTNRVVSWRWQACRGIEPDASVLVFHGQPKPHEVTDPEIVTLWC